MDNKELVRAVFQGLEETIVNLAGRWMDEQEYEDIHDYRAVIEEAVEELNYADVTVTKMSKRPFGVDIQVGRYLVQIRCTASEYKFKAIAPTLKG